MAGPDGDAPDRQEPATTPIPDDEPTEELTERTTAGTETPTTTTTTTTESTAIIDDGPDEEDSGLLFGLGLIVLIPLALAGSVGTYAGGVLVVGLIFGRDAVAGLPFSGAITSIPQLTMSTLIGTAGVTSSFAGQLRTVLSALGGGAAALAKLPAEFGRVLTIAVTGPLRALGKVTLGFGAGLGSLFGAVSNLSVGLGRRGSRDSGSDVTTDAREAGGPAPEESEDEPPPEPSSVRDAFDRMLDRLRVRNSHAKTPAELADAAIERGWPSGPVETLTRLFREVRYGGREDSEERTERAASAYERLRDYWRRSG